MSISKGFGAISLGVLVLVVGFSNNDMLQTPLSEIQQGSGKMTVLYDGKDGGPIDFGTEKWAPGDTRSITVEIRNEGEIDFISSVNSGAPSVEGSLINEMDTTIRNESGDILFHGAYPEINITGLDIPVGKSEKLKVAVQWVPAKDVDLSKERSDSFSMSVNAQQKI
jgi:hypothetical protein